MQLTITIKAGDAGKVRETLEVIEAIKKVYPNAVFHIEVTV